MTTPTLLIFGLGYTAQHLAQRLTARGWNVVGTTRDGRGGSLRFDDLPAVRAALAAASHILSSVPPGRDGRDAVLDVYGEALAVAPVEWLGYLSSTGVYGDVGGAWVDESAPIKGRRLGRNASDADWAGLRADVRIFRLPGIYGPGRSAIDRVREGAAHRVDVADQVFSRVHVDDIASAIIASMHSDARGIFNLADDVPCSQNRVIEEAARLLGVPPPPLVALDDASISDLGRAFYAENRRVANGRAKRLLGWKLRHPSFVEGLADLN